MALSYVTYTANGSTNQFDVTFSYIDQSHVKVYIDNVADNSFTWVNSSRIQTSSTPANSAVVKIDRDTPTDARLVDFSDGAVLSETDLDKSANQNFFVAQETVDEVEDKLPNLLILHFNMGNFPIRLITGNSEKMKEIVRETCEVQGFTIDDTWNTNPGTIILRS